MSWIGNLPNVYCRVWIDFNNNKTFETNEIVLERNGVNPLTSNVLVPTTATTGSVRMRVSMKWGAYPTACETFDRGEVEDYTISIQGGGTDPCLTDVTPPVFQNCPANIALTTTTTTAVATWAAPTATDNCTAPPSVTSTQNSGFAFPIGTTTVVYTATDAKNNRATCSFNVVVSTATTGGADIAVSLVSTPSVFSKFAPLAMTITAKNIGNQAVTNAIVEFKFPVGTTNGGTATPSVGTWNEWCSGGIQCFEWRIPSLAANARATLNLPLYVLSPTSPIIAVAKLLSSTPTDGNAANNTTTLTINPATPPTQPLIRQKPTQLIPIVLQALNPSLTEGDIIVELESLIDKSVRFGFYNVDGKLMQSESRAIQKGTNRLSFEVFDLPQGVYFIQTDAGTGHRTPIRFVKM